MPGSLLVGLDGSKFSQRATDEAIRLIKQSGGLLLGIGIVDEPGIRKGEAVSIGGSYYKAAAEDQHIQSARDKIQRFQQDFLERCSLAAVPAKAILAVGHPWEQIVTEAQQCDAIVLGLETYFHFETNVEACESLKLVLKHAPRPVIAVPASPPWGSNIVVAYDGSLQAARMLASLLASGLCASGDVHVVGIHEDRDEALNRVRRAVAFLGYHRISAVAHPIAASDRIVTTLLERADALNAGLIAMGAYGKSTLHDFFFGSVTKTMLRTSHLPLFLFH